MFSEVVTVSRVHSMSKEICFHVESEPFYGLEEFNKSSLLDSISSETDQHIAMATSDWEIL